MPTRSSGMHISSTRVGRGRFRHHLTRTAPEPADDPFQTTGAKVERGHARERLEHLHRDFELEQRFSRDSAA
jgi:hypothetical protein